MRKILTGIFVSLVMIIGILGITNPGGDHYKMFDYVEGKLIHNYVVFSLYQQSTGYTVIENGKYRLYKRYIGIVTKFYEISPIKVKHE
jgi:hypothetical protein